MGFANKAEYLTAQLNATYQGIGITYTVELDESIRRDWCGTPPCGTFTTSGSGLLDNDYSGNEAEVINLYKSRTGYVANDQTTAYLFAVGGAVNNADGEEGPQQGKMNFGKQFGFLYSITAGHNAQQVGRTLAHELGHGNYKLHHIFREQYLGETAKNSTNIMSYSTSPTDTVLNKYQWDIIHDPGTIWGFAVSDADQAIIGFSDYKGTRQIIEQIRFGYAFNRSVKITNDNSTGTGADNITLGDGLKYEKLLIGFHKALPITLNPRSCELPDDFSVLGNTDALRTGFCYAKQTNSRAFYTVEFESKTAKSEFANLKKYLLCESKEKWSSHIDDLINSGGYSLANLSALSGEALKELSNKQRIDLLDKIAKVNMKDYDPLAAKVMANVSSEDITDLFEKLKETTLFHTYKEQMNHDNYTEFIISATLLYYQQGMLKEKLKNITPDKMFAHQYREGAIGASITNEFSATTKEFTITGNVVVVSRSDGSGSPYEAYNQQPNQTTSFHAYSNKVNYFDLIGVEMYSDLGNIQGNGKVIPMPAFYFDWLYTNQNRENTIKAIDASVTILSLAVGIGELRMVVATGRGIFIAKTSLSILKSAVNLVLLDDNLRTSIENQEYGQGFLDIWKVFCWVYDISTFDLKNINKNRDFFNDFVMAWTVSNTILEQNLDKELIEDIQTLINEIEQNK